MTLNVSPIGYVECDYTKPYDAPRQPFADDRIHESIIRLLPNNNFEQALEDLSGFHRLWVVAWMHEATSWKPKILTPRDRTKRGVFATRSPHRPNPISISCVELIKVKKLKIVVKGLDLLNGTPVLDIKPYLPYCDAFPDSATGWVDDIDEHTYSVAVAEDVGFSDIPDEITSYVFRVLSNDPTPHPYRRISAHNKNMFELAHKEYRFEFVVEGNDVVILAVNKL